MLNWALSAGEQSRGKGEHWSYLLAVNVLKVTVCLWINTAAPCVFLPAPGHELKNSPWHDKQQHTLLCYTKKTTPESCVHCWKVLQSVNKTQLLSRHCIFFNTKVPNKFSRWSFNMKTITNGKLHCGILEYWHNSTPYLCGTLCVSTILHASMISHVRALQPEHRGDLRVKNHQKQKSNIPYSCPVWDLRFILHLSFSSFPVFCLIKTGRQRIDSMSENLKWPLCLIVSFESMWRKKSSLGLFSNVIYSD